MSSLNLSTNGPSITASYQKVLNTAPASTAASTSPTYGTWALFTVQAPLVSAFQTASSTSESVLKVQTTGEGELIDLIEDFSDGRIQFAFLKVRDPNTTLPKNVLIAWCGEGVPERTKGFFTSHVNAVAKVLHGYHVQITARSDRDLTPQGIVQKVADASGSRYSGGGGESGDAEARPPPPLASKPTMPTKSFGAAGGFQPLGARSRAPAPASAPVDDDGWTQDAPPVMRSQLEKVQTAYQPTKVNMASLQSQQEPSRYTVPASQPQDSSDGVIRGGYQPIGKVDINAIRQQAQQTSTQKDDRPTIVKGAYEPVGKVDIAEIRRKAQGAPAPSQPQSPPPPQTTEDDRPKSLADRSAAFTNPSAGSERLTSLPKPQTSNRFGSSTSAFSGTRAPAPGGFEAKPMAAAAAPVGTASKTFADEGGKTPAQIWAEKKARQRGNSAVGEEGMPAPIQSQTSGGATGGAGSWQSGYAGKKWGVQIPSRTGGSAGVPDEEEESRQDDQDDRDAAVSGNVSSIRDRFAGSTPMGAPSSSSAFDEQPPQLPTASKSNRPAEESTHLPPPPPRGIPDEEEDEAEPQATDDYEHSQAEAYESQGSPVRIAMPVSRSAAPEIVKAEPLPPAALPTNALAEAVASHREPSPEPEEDPGRGAAQIAAASTFGAASDARGAGNAGGQEAIAQYDYDKAEDNELQLRDGERITGIEMVDEDWWMGVNERGESGLFPANYVELVAGGGAGGREEEEVAPAPVAAAGVGGGAAAGGNTAVAQYDYEAAEDNELSFPDGAKITDIEFTDENWWLGSYGGKTGLFPANYVELDQ